MRPRLDPKRRFGRLASLVLACGAASAGLRPVAWAQPVPAARTAILPPPLPWHGTSRKLEARPRDRWATPWEASGMKRTPSYAETVTWVQRLAETSPDLEMISLGQSSEGRDVWMVVAAHASSFTPEALHATGKPILLAQAGIHAGEIDGKDAGLMLLRDLSVGKKGALLDAASFLFVPIFNVDGHERSSPFTRINQRGPEVAGWRTTARNLNLNRDYTKADCPEMRAMLRALGTWDPDLCLDLHVTDGGDYQYDITWGYDLQVAYSPAATGWLDGALTPALERALRAMGHVPGPLVFPVEGRDVTRGIAAGVSQPRFSTGYGDVRHLPTVLVENHSLKPYEQRVLGTYVLLETALKTLGEKGGDLRQATAVDRGLRPDPVPLEWKAPATPPQVVDFLGVESRLVTSRVTGALYPQYTGKPVVLRVPRIRQTETSRTVKRPRAYWIPPAWGEVIERLRLHGIEMERLESPRQLEVEMYRFSSARFDSVPFEGRVRVTAKGELERRHETLPTGSVRVPTDQPLGDLAVVLLEPESGDSFFQWGFFDAVLQQTEYVEGYIMEPMAEKMLAESPALRAAYQKKLLEDPKFEADPDARLRWFYLQTPFFDDHWRLYPVSRE